MIDKNFINTLANEGSKAAFIKPSVIVAKWLGITLLYFIGIAIFTGPRFDVVSKLGQPLYLTELVLIILVGITAAIASSFLALPDSNQRPWIRFVPFFPLAFSIGILARGI